MSAAAVHWCDIGHVMVWYTAAQGCPVCVAEDRAERAEDRAEQAEARVSRLREELVRAQGLLPVIVGEP